MLSSSKGLRYMPQNTVKTVQVCSIKKPIFHDTRPKAMGQSILAFSVHLVKWGQGKKIV